MAITLAAGGRAVPLTGLIPSATLNGFVALITLDNIPTDMIDAGSLSAANGGGDLQFATDALGVNQIPCEIVSFVTNATPSNRSCQIWVRFATYASGTRDVYAFYKQAQVSQPAVTDAYGRNAVYADREYQYNFYNASSIIDSKGVTTPTVFGTPIDDMTSPSGGGVRFDAGEHINLNQNVGDTTGDLTLRTWIKPIGSNSFATIIAIRSGATWSYQWRLESLDNAILIGSVSPNSPAAPLVAGTWYQLTLTISGTTITYYHDGVSVGTGLVSGVRSLNPTIDTSIGNIAAGGGSTLDVLSSLANTSAEFGAISSDRVASEYANQSSPATFWTTGATFSTEGGGGGPSILPVIMNQYKQRRA